MTRQAQKHTLGLAGEFFVTAELLRRGILASVTYGNAKRADVVALSASKTSAVVVEVKSTSSQKWVIGNSVPVPSEQIWVLVHLPALDTISPRYFILTSRELHGILAPLDAEYRRNFKARNKMEFTGSGVVSLSLAQAAAFEAKWSTLVSRVAAG